MQTPAYRVLRYRDFPCILCLICNRISHNPNDVQHRYCGNCQVFLETVPEDYRQTDPEGRSPGLLLEGSDDGTGFALAHLRRWQPQPLQELEEPEEGDLHAE